MPKWEPEHSHIRVKGAGPMDAPILLIGDAPAVPEVLWNGPFVGQGGQRLFGGGKERGWVVEAGLRREQFRLEYVCEYCPPHTIADRWDKDTWLQWMEDLHERIARLDHLVLIVPTGNYALYALTGKGKVHWHTRDGKESRPGILDWRGSLLSYTDRRGRRRKVIPTPHPAATFPGRDPGLEPVCKRDWKRIAAEAGSVELNIPVRTHIINPTQGDLDLLVRTCEAMGDDEVVALDIENPREKGGGAPIVCVGFAPTPQLSITVPTSKKSKREWEVIEHVLSLPVAKVAHNNFHEAYWLWAEREIEVVGMWWDTMYMNHVLDPAAPHSLDFCASVDTREPFWKHEAKDPEDQRKYTSNLAAFYTYNGKDCCVTRELFDVYYQRLLEEVRRTSYGVIDGVEFYLRHYAELYQPLLGLMRAGVRVDESRRAERYAELVAQVGDLKGRLVAQGIDIYSVGKTAKGGISRQKLAKYLYEELGLPKQYVRNKKKGEKTVTTNEVAIRTLAEKHPDKLGQVAPLILDQTRLKKLSEFYTEGRVDEDGYFRSSYGLNTEAGRLQSKKAPNGGGSNAQNIDREARDMFLADHGCIGVEVDLSQAEARIVYLAIYKLTGDTDMLNKARLRPTEYDQHTEMAAKIFGFELEQYKAMKKTDPEQFKLYRYLGKTTVHAAQREQSGKGLSERLAKDGYFYSIAECDGFIKAYRRAVPGLEDYFRDVRRRIMQDKLLVTDWGRVLKFDYARLDDSLYRAGYSFDPQANVADHMNQKGLKPLADWFEREQCGRINVHAHDALFFSVVPERAWDATKFLIDSLESPFTYHGTSLCMPCEVKVGLSWKGTSSWGQLPTQSTFEEAVYELTTRHDFDGAQWGIGDRRAS